MNALSYTIRTNINITIVAMVLEDNERANHTNIRESCPTNLVDVPSSSSSNNDHYLHLSINESFVYNNFADSDDIHYNEGGLKLFDWSESLQGTILGAYYYGYILTNFNGGQLAELLGTRRLLTISMILSAILTMLIPWAAFCHPWLLIVIRILTGIAQGVVTPAIYQLLSYWIPRNELGLAFGLIPASGYIGAVITMPACAFLSQYGFFGGWPSVFYVSGAVGMISLVPWLFFVYDSPDVHPRITENELIYIQTNSMTQRRGSTRIGEKANTWVPWLSIISSRKIWGITISKFCTSWGNLFLMSKLPTYLSQVLNMPITYNSYVNASIYISLGGSMLSWGSVADWIERRQCLGRTASRKLFQTIALVGSAAFLASIPLFGCQIIPIIVMLNLSMITLGLTAGGDSLIIVDVAPDYSGSIYGFSNSIASLPGFLAPMFVGFLLDLPHDDEMKQWSILFWIGAGIYLIGSLVFLLFVDSKPESWGKQQQQQQPLDSNSKSNHHHQPTEKQITSRISESDLFSNTTTSSSYSSSSSAPSTTDSLNSNNTTIVIVEPDHNHECDNEKNGHKQNQTNILI
ncbi:sialin-like protein [Euroglyphus maynei]|uniref:Sialin-like protein n=1 Tax=Euroglyphus maynei TaxID=6958 RepID=A0A1Y3BL40_EURMA|nr:sialin-like protein [Euroglyphus maynei]